MDKSTKRGLSCEDTLVLRADEDLSSAALDQSAARGALLGNERSALGDGGDVAAPSLGENWWRQFTPAEIAAIDADIAKLDRLMAERRQKMLAELDTLETSARSELRVIHRRRAELLGRQGVLS